MTAQSCVCWGQEWCGYGLFCSLCTLFALLTVHSYSLQDVSVVVNVSAQTNAVSTGFVGYYPPLLLSISPDAGPALGGTVVTFTGVNFGATAVPLTFTLANPSQGITGVTCTVLVSVPLVPPIQQ